VIVLKIVAAIVFALVGMILGLALAGPADYDTPLGKVKIEVEPSTSPGVEIFVPDVDAGVRADAFAAPVSFRAEPFDINAAGAAEAAIGQGKVLQDTQDDLIAAGIASVVRFAIWGLGGVILAGLAVFGLFMLLRERRAWLWGLLTVGIGVFAIVILALWIVLTFDATTFENPEITGETGKQVNQLVTRLENADNVDQIIESFAPFIEEATGDSGK
jgi:hypothetical protein